MITAFIAKAAIAFSLLVSFVLGMVFWAWLDEQGRKADGCEACPFYKEAQRRIDFKV